MNQTRFANVEDKFKGLDRDEFQYYKDEAKSALDADEPNRLRCMRNIAAYTGLYNSQWNSDILNKILEGNRKVETRNFLAYYVEGLAGNYIANWFDPRIVATRDEDIDTWAEVQRTYYIDKQRHGYKSVSLSVIVNGLCCRGLAGMRIDRSRDRRGEIAFVSENPYMTVIDPSVTSDNICRDAKKAWKYPYLSIEEMIYLYSARTDDILREAYKRDKKNGKQYEKYDYSTFSNLGGKKKFGARYQCCEHLHLEVEPRHYRKDQLTGLDVPEFKRKSDQEEWEASNGANLSLSEGAGLITDVVSYVPLLYLTTWCEELNVVLENRLDERQIARLPLWDWSYITKHGKSIGVVDLLWDAAQSFNRISTSKTQWLTQTGKSKPIFHEDAFGGDKKLLDDTIENLSDPSQPIVLPSGSPPPNQVVGYLQNSEPPQSLYQAEQMEMQLLNLIARMPPALQGITERTNESGIHYGRKVIEASILQRVPVEKLIQHELEKTEGYVIMAPKTYGGPHNINRSFMSDDGRTKAMLNEYKGVDETGRPNIAKDITKAQRPSVVIDVTKENTYMKQAKREMDTEILKSMSQTPDPSNAEVKAIFENRLLLESDFTDLAEKEAAETAVKRRMQLLGLQMDALIGQATIAKTQMEQQAAMAANPQAQAMAQQQQGQPQAQGQPPPAAEQVQPTAKPMMNTEKINEQNRPLDARREPVAPIKPIG